MTKDNVQEPVVTDWERIAKVQDAKLRAMCNEPKAFEQLCELMDKYEALRPTPPAAQRQWVGLTDDEKQSVCRTGPVYAPNGVVTRTPLQYRAELEGVAWAAVRKAEAKLREKNT
jgi:hypothetical protein